MAKSVIDCMSKVGLVVDDAQIFRLSLEKYLNPRSDIDREQGYIAIHLIYHS
jgi:Holliday junction resolvase RusA-like endonuclease